MSYSDDLVQPRIGGKVSWPAAATRLPRGPETSTNPAFDTLFGTDVLPRVLEAGRSRFLDSGQGASPAVVRRSAELDCGRESWSYRTLADLRPDFGDKASDLVELILVGVYASAALAEMAMVLTAGLH